MKKWVKPQLNCITFDKTQETACTYNYWTWKCTNGCEGKGDYAGGSPCPYNCGGTIVQRCEHIS